VHPARRPRHPDAKDTTASELLERILSVLDENKAEDIVTIDLAGKTPMADFMVVASGRSQRQVQALADYVGRAVKEVAKAPKIEGQSQADWILIDAGDVIVHLFRPEVREFYKIEAMWGHETAASAMEPSVS
jgi:ribosome-associated protein